MIDTVRDAFPNRQTYQSTGDAPAIRTSTLLQSRKSSNPGLYRAKH